MKPEDESFDIQFHGLESEKQSQEMSDSLSLEVILDKRIPNSLWDHACKGGRNEVAGVLVGEYTDNKAHIRGVIPASSKNATAVRVTITHDDWNYVHHIMKTTFPTMKIVGWYHTHPGHGVFMSGQDVFTHNSFFTHPGNIALVLDHIQKEIALFTSDKGNIVQVNQVHFMGSDRKKWERMLLTSTNTNPSTIKIKLLKPLFDEPVLLFQNSPGLKTKKASFDLQLQHSPPLLEEQISRLVETWFHKVKLEFYHKNQEENYVVEGRVYLKDTPMEEMSMNRVVGYISYNQSISLPSPPHNGNWRVWTTPKEKLKVAVKEDFLV